MTERCKAVVRALVDAVNAHDLDRVAELVAEGFVRHSAAAGRPGVRSRDDLLRFLRAEREATLLGKSLRFPHAHFALIDGQHIEAARRQE